MKNVKESNLLFLKKERTNNWRSNSNKQGEMAMMESIRQKIKKTFSSIYIVYCAVLVISMTGCGKSTPTKYFLYRKRGDAKSGEYIKIYGLNYQCDIHGKLKVNLDDIQKKYKGKIVIPAKIDGLPVKEVESNLQGYLMAENGEHIGNGLVSCNKGEKIFNYTGDNSPYKYDPYVTEVTLPDSVEKYSCFGEEEKIFNAPINDDLDIGQYRGKSKLKEITFRNEEGKNLDMPDLTFLTLVENLTLPPCINTVNLVTLPRNLKTLQCSENTLFYFYAIAGVPILGQKSTNPQETMDKIVGVHKGRSQQQLTRDLGGVVGLHKVNNPELQRDWSGGEVFNLTINGNQRNIKLDVNKVKFVEVSGEMLKAYESFGRVEVVKKEFLKGTFDSIFK